MAEIPTFLIDGQDVPMDQMRRYLTRLSGQAESALLNSIDGAAPFATLALAQAAPSVGAGSQARVFNDPDPVKNGLYVNATGASGGYALDEQFYAALSRVVQPIVNDAEAARDEAEAIVSSLKRTGAAVIGNTSVATGGPISALTVITNKAAEGDGFLKKFRVFMLNAGTARLNTFSVRTVGSTIVAKPTRTAVVLNLPAGASYVDISIPISEGEHPGFYAGANVSSGSGTGNPIYYISGDATALTNEFPVQPFSSTNTQFGFDYTFEMLALARFEVVATEAIAQSLSITNPTIFYLVAS